MPERRFRNEPLLTAEQLESRIGEFYRAVDEFNAGYYFESHETLEDLWMVTPLPDRQLFQAMIQLAAAFVHFARREFPGINKLLDASADKLDEFGSGYRRVDVPSLLADVRCARAEFARLGPEGYLGFREVDIPLIRLAGGAPTPASSPGSGTSSASNPRPINNK